uniref:FYVE-type domain-containing protein n=1 Tax=Hyaloperonospora arabidopsidis (strain Emoy2) TaxID=559515 RepID=M4BJ77_HYAAE
MKFTVPKNTLDTVKLSQNLQDAITEEADTVVRETVAASEYFVFNLASKLDPKHWKLVRTKDGVQVFRQRQKAIDHQGPDVSNSPLIQSPLGSHGHAMSRYCTRGSKSSSTQDLSGSQAFTFTPSGIAEDSIMEKMRPPGIALMALHGTIDGSLDDCMFGSVAANDAEWRLRSSHINERFNNTWVLATIKEPTIQDPCQFLGVKWFTKEHPAVLSGVMQQRDFLIIESVGFTCDSKGERVGYVILHSVTLRDVPEFAHLGMVRGNMSFCHLFRQSGPGKVDVFSRGFFDSRGGMPGRLSVAIAAEAAICCTNLVELAYMKKLRWLMSKLGKRNQLQRESRPSRCEACGNSFSKSLLSSAGSGVNCQICYNVVCAKCTVAKKIIMDVLVSGAVQQGTFQFCLKCFMTAKQRSGWDMVRSDFTLLSKHPT